MVFHSFFHKFFTFFHSFLAIFSISPNSVKLRIIKDGRSFLRIFAF